jgi:predicted transposase/invertase (TIGR01784 family)
MNKLFNRLNFNKELKRLARENFSQGKPLSVLDDVVFKAMLGSNSEDSNEALRSLLSACTRREVRKVQILNNDLPPAYLGAKTARLDVHVTFNDGETADLEMQTDKYADDLKKRAEFYTSMLMAGQYKRGKLYRDVKRVYQIFFLNCVLFPQSDKFPRRYFYQEEEEHDRLSEVTEIIFYELPKLETRLNACLANGAVMENLPEDEKWCIYMKYRHEQRAGTLIEELCRKEAGIMRAEQAVRKISRDDKRYARYVAEMKNNIDLMFAEERGRKEGIYEIARKMKTAGRPLSEIAEFTGLPTETIEQITDNR